MPLSPGFTLSLHKLTYHSSHYLRDVEVLPHFTDEKTTFGSYIPSYEQERWGGQELQGTQWPCCFFPNPESSLYFFPRFWKNNSEEGNEEVAEEEKEEEEEVAGVAATVSNLTHWTRFDAWYVGLECLVGKSHQCVASGRRSRLNHSLKDKEGFLPWKGRVEQKFTVDGLGPLQKVWVLPGDFLLCIKDLSLEVINQILGRISIYYLSIQL